MPGELTFEIDDAAGFVRVRGTGLWTVAQASIHFIQLRRAIEALRAIRRPVRVLVDLSEAAVQTAAVTEAISEGTARIYREADAVALVAGTMLLALQMKRASRAPNLAVFSDVDAAASWLSQQRAETRMRLSA